MNNAPSYVKSFASGIFGVIDDILSAMFKVHSFIYLNFEAITRFIVVMIYMMVVSSKVPLIWSDAVFEGALLLLLLLLWGYCLFYLLVYPQEDI